MMQSNLKESNESSANNTNTYDRQQENTQSGDVQFNACEFICSKCGKRFIVRK